MPGRARGDKKGEKAPASEGGRYNDAASKRGFAPARSVRDKLKVKTPTLQNQGWGTQIHLSRSRASYSSSVGLP
jgi:hypothetical protein